jgi:thioredoxin reductase (NADPH)
VTISYRRAELGRGAAKRHLVDEVRMWICEGKIRFLPETVPIEITPEHVVLAPTRDGRRVEGGPRREPADFVLLATGFVADMSLFEKLGVKLAAPRQVPEFSPETMETNVPGVYVAGTAAGGSQVQYKLFIETSHADVEKIASAILRQERSDPP